MDSLAQTVKRYLEDDGWDYDYESESKTFRTGVVGENGNYGILVHANEDDQIVLLYMAIENIVPSDARVRVCEYLCRANFGLAIGNFEIDMEDGEVVFRVSVDVDGCELSELMVANMFEEAIATMDRFYTGLVAVAMNGVEAIDAMPEEIQPH